MHLNLVLCFLFVEAATCKEVTTNSSGLENDIRLPQIGSLEKFLRVGIAYTIPKGKTVTEAYENFKNDTPEAIEIKSPNYPQSYPTGENHNYTINVENCTGIEIIIHDFDIDPIKDFLKFSPYRKDGSLSNGTIFTGKINQPLKLRSVGSTKLEMEFGAWTKSNHSFKGFLLTYEPYGQPVAPIAPPPDFVPQFNERESISKLLTVPAVNQTKETWQSFHNLICSAINKYLNESNNTLELCHSENVTIKSVTQCNIDWPDSSNCIELSFAVSLYLIRNETTDDAFEESQPRYPGGLSAKQLEEMWGHYGEAMFSAVGFPPFKIPDYQSTILLWVGLGLGALLVAFIVLVAMWRAGIQQNWRSTDDDKQNILKVPTEPDITMFPSPDQVVPALFPTAEVETFRTRSNCSIDDSDASDALRRKSSFGFVGGINPVFIEDDEYEPNRFSTPRTFMKGISRSEATT